MQSVIPKKIQNEQKVVQIMINKYCQGNHEANKLGLCDSCINLLDYCNQRLLKCVFAEKKPFCSKCPIHCYKRDMREEIKAVMKYSGPKMIFSHPILAIGHLLTKFKKFDDPRFKN